MKKILPTICLLLFITSCCFGILYYTSKEDEPINEIKSEKETTPLRSSVYSGKITNEFTCDGSVTNGNSDEYIECITINNTNSKNSDNMNLKCKIGQELSKGDEIFINKEKAIYANYSCKVVDIVNANSAWNIYLLNYDKLYIITSISYDKLDLINSNTKAVVIYKKLGEEQTADAEITKIGYEVKENSVDICLKTKTKLLPGTPIKVKLETINQTESKYILKRMLMMDTDTYYVEKENSDGSRTRINVDIGNTFKEYNNGIEEEFVEITGNLSVNDKLIIDIIEG